MSDDDISYVILLETCRSIPHFCEARPEPVITNGETLTPRGTFNPRCSPSGDQCPRDTFLEPSTVQVMAPSAWIGMIVTMALFVISHIIITVWWAARVNTLLDVVQRDLSAIVVELKSLNKLYATKEEVVYEKALSEKEHEAMWRRIDELKSTG